MIAYFILGLKPCSAPTTGHVDLARPADLFAVSLVDEDVRVGLGHVGLVHGQHQRVVGLLGQLGADAVGGERGCEDAHALAPAVLVLRAALAQLLLGHAAALVVAVHAEVALRVEVAVVVQLATCADRIVLAANYRMSNNVIT